MTDTKKRYGCWAGNPKGFPEDPDRCIVEVWPRYTWVARQCRRKRGYGKNGLHCKQHAKRLEEGHHHD
jgi:hypothetical protein